MSAPNLEELPSWAARLPAGWKVLPMRRILRRVEQGWSPVAEDRVTSSDEWAVIKLSAVSDGAFVADEHKALDAATIPDPRFEIREGDVLLTRANTPDLVGDACFVRATRPRLMLSDLVYRLELDLSRVDPAFLVYWLRSAPGRAQIRADARGSSQSMVKVSQGHIGSWLVSLPPLAVQRRIVAALDRRTSAVEEVIRKKERLLELLQEKRQALITESITRGMDASAPLKARALPWLGRVPAHWVQTRVKHVVRFATSGSRGWSEYFAETGAIFLQSGNLIGDLGVDLVNVQRVNLPSGTEGQRTRVRRGDVLVCITGGLTGNVGLVVDEPDEAYVNQHLCLVRPRARCIEARYLAYLLASNVAQEQFGINKYGLKEGLGLDDVRNVEFAAPPVEEQAQIADWLDTTLSELGVVRSVLDRQVGLLREYRQSIISASVTGQLDVQTAEAA